MRPALATFALFALPLLARAAGDDGPAPPDVLCREEKATCKEDCSLDYGLSEQTRAKVPKCLADCEQAEVICLARHVAKRHAGQAKADHAATPPAEETAAPPMDDDLPPVRKRTSTRASELKGVPEKKPEGYEEKVFSKPVPEAPSTLAPSPPALPPPVMAAPPPSKKKPPRKRAPAKGAPPVTPAE